MENLEHRANLDNIMLNIMPMCTSCWNKDYQPIACNDEAMRLFKVESRQQYLECFYQLSPECQPDGENSVDAAKRQLQKAFDEGHNRFEWMHQTIEGELIPCETTLIRSDYNDEPVIAGYTLDLRERLANMAKLREADERMRVLMNATPLAATFWNSNLECIDCNQESLNLFNLNSKEEYLTRFHELSPKRQACGTLSRKLAKTYLRMAFEEGRVSAEWIHQTLDGLQIPSELTLVRVKYKNTFIVASYIRDLRELKATMEKMHEVDERAKIMLEATPICCTLTNSLGRIIDCNQETLKLFGVKSKEEYINRFYELRPEYQPDGQNTLEMVVAAAIKAKTEGYAKFELMHQKLDGTPIHTELTLVKVYLHGEEIIAGYCRDLTEINAYMAKIREADERTQIMLDATPLCCSLLDHWGRPIDCNQEAVNLFGLTSKKDYLDLFYQLEPETQPNGDDSTLKGLEYIAQAFTDGYCRFEWMHRKLNGELIPAEITLVKVNYRGADIVAGYTRDLRELKAMLKEMHKVEEDLRIARDAAESSANAKSEFLATMSHEIRTPMNGVLGLLYLVLQTNLTKKQRDYLEKTETSAKNLLRIINDILDFSKIEAGKLDMESVEFCMDDLIKDVAALFEPGIKAKGLTLSIAVPYDLPATLIGDSLRLKQVLINLIGNAVKFTDNGNIGLNITKVRQNDTNCWLKFAVRDNGIGLTKEQLHHLFAPFSQADSSITRRYGGTGLGLAIAKNLVTLMHGEIWAESAYGEGSEFHFTICCNVPEADAATKPKNADKNMPFDIALLKKLTEEDNPRVLLVEDNEINQLIALEILDLAGVKADAAFHGAEALSMLNDNEYDLVLMDIQMPVMDGLTCVQIMRSQHKLSRLPVIGMSAHAMAGDYEKSLKAGMNDYITKPISPAILYKTLYKWLKDESLVSDPEKENAVA